jgi:hypothetical protein
MLSGMAWYIPALGWNTELGKMGPNEFDNLENKIKDVREDNGRFMRLTS